MAADDTDLRSPTPPIVPREIDAGTLFPIAAVLPNRVRDVRIDDFRPLAVDLFAGAGGLSLGFEQAGFDIAAAVELDPVHALVHEFNFPYGEMLCRDASTVSGNEIRSLPDIGDREIHVVVGGAPCQGFSLIGKRQLDDPRNRLLVEFARLVLELQPRHFVLENVAGLTVGEHRAVLDEVINYFNRNGYAVRLPYRVLQAADFGVPQSRRRLFLLGSREDRVIPEYPAAQFTPRSMNGEVPLPVAGRPLGPSVKDALADIPDANLFTELLIGDSVHTDLGSPSPYARRLRSQVNDDDDYSRIRPFDRGILTASMRTKHTSKSARRFEATIPGTTEPVSRFLRLHPDGISNTLRAGTASDRGAYTSPRPIHPWLPRVITVREAARLHGFPDWFRFHATKWHGFREIGNSVPPILARAVANEILRADGLAPSVGVETPLGNPLVLNATATMAERHFGYSERVIPQRTRKVG